jgi:ribosomal protein S18 acetylase RimI-like enzyme
MARPAPTTGQPESIQPLRLEQIPLLEPLWRALLDRIRVPESVVPIVAHEESWPTRSAEYQELLSKGDSFGLVALRGDQPVGYAVVRVEDRPDPVWATGERYVELTSLSVAPGERDRGIGTRLLDEVERRLWDMGVTGLVIGVDAVNEDARRFYERRGFRVGYHLLYGRLGDVVSGRDVVSGDRAGDGDPGTASHGEA